MNPISLKNFPFFKKFPAEVNYWFVIYTIVMIVNLLVIPVDQGLIRQEAHFTALLIRLFNALFFGSLLLVSYLSPRQFEKYSDLFLLLAVLLVCTSMSYLETVSTKTSYYNGIIQTYFAIAFGKLKLATALICYITPPIIYWYIAGWTRFELISVEVYLFAFIGLIINRIIAHLIESRIKKAKDMTLYQWTASMAHELQTPVANIRIYVQGLLNSLDSGRIDKNDFREKLLDISKLCQNMLVLHNQMLLNARTDHLDNVHFELLSLLENVRTAVESYYYKHPEEVRLIDIDVQDDFQFAGSRVLFINVIHNLLRNSLREIGEKGRGRISIRIEKEEPYNILVFRDTAGGLPVSLQRQIFEPGFSLVQGGTGYGLPFCKAVMELFSGDIQCKSDGKSYTEFILRFPI